MVRGLAAPGGPRAFCWNTEGWSPNDRFHKNDPLFMDPKQLTGSCKRMVNDWLDGPSLGPSGQDKFEIRVIIRGC